MEWYPLDGQSGLLGNMYHHMWRKNAHGQSCPGISLPHTVLFRLNRPYAWYFTSKTGDILRKRAVNATPEAIYEAFVNEGTRGKSEVVAVFMYPSVSGVSERPMVVFEYLTTKTLGLLLHHRNKPDGSVLQSFVDPVEEYNTVIRADWSPQMLELERRTNVCRLHDTHVDIYQRMVTFDGAAHNSVSSGVKQHGTIGKLRQACDCIAEHVAVTSGRGTQPRRLVLFFKIDVKNAVTLLWCSYCQIPHAVPTSRLRDTPAFQSPTALDESLAIMRQSELEVANQGVRRVLQDLEPVSAPVASPSPGKQVKLRQSSISVYSHAAPPPACHHASHVVGCSQCPGPIKPVAASVFSTGHFQRKSELEAPSIATSHSRLSASAQPVPSFLFTVPDSEHSHHAQPLAGMTTSGGFPAGHAPKPRTFQCRGCSRVVPASEFYLVSVRSVVRHYAALAAEARQRGPSPVPMEVDPYFQSPYEVVQSVDHAPSAVSLYLPQFRPTGIPLDEPDASAMLGASMFTASGQRAVEIGFVPPVLVPVVPGGSIERFQRMCQDPSFLYRTLRVCEQCHLSFSQHDTKIESRASEQPLPFPDASTSQASMGERLVQSSLEGRDFPETDDIPQRPVSSASYMRQRAAVLNVPLPPRPRTSMLLRPARQRSPGDPSAALPDASALPMFDVPDASQFPFRQILVQTPTPGGDMGHRSHTRAPSPEDSKIPSPRPPASPPGTTPVPTTSRAAAGRSKSALGHYRRPATTSSLTQEWAPSLPSTMPTSPTPPPSRPRSSRPRVRTAETPATDVATGDSLAVGSVEDDRTPVVRQVPHLWARSAKTEMVYLASPGGKQHPRSARARMDGAAKASRAMATAQPARATPRPPARKARSWNSSAAVVDKSELVEKDRQLRFVRPSVKGQVQRKLKSASTDLSPIDLVPAGAVAPTGVEHADPMSQSTSVVDSRTASSTASLDGADNPVDGMEPIKVPQAIHESASAESVPGSELSPSPGPLHVPSEYSEDDDHEEHVQ